MAIKKILLLGDKKLFRKSVNVSLNELKSIHQVIEDLHDTLMDYRKRYGAGRAIAAPQIGIFKRVIYLNIDGPLAIINPMLEYAGSEQMEVWDDCMCFPGLYVKVLRYKQCKITYKDLSYHEHTDEYANGLAELLQHEYDHLDGTLATQHAIDTKSFYFSPNLLKKRGRVSPPIYP